jgi:NADPH:quinone reductase-like Zn-dependent oxidoreductase
MSGDAAQLQSACPETRFERSGSSAHGSIGELEVVEVPRPVATPGRVIVDVVAAAINPGETVIREGRLHERWPA